MDGKLDSVVNSIGLSMAMNESYIVDCVLSPHDWDQCIQAIHMLFEHDDTLPNILFSKSQQVVLDNGSELNRIGQGRGFAGRKPHMVIFDETYGHMKNEIIKTGAPMVVV